MGYYAEILPVVKRNLRDKEKYQGKVKEVWGSIETGQRDLLDLINAQKLLSTVSDDITTDTLDFVAGVVNKALGEILKGSGKKIHLEKKLYGDSKPHIVLKLNDGKGHLLDISDQSGTGLRQIISVLFVICLIEIRKGRRLVLLDERLSGLHKEAKRVLAEILKIFADGGFQFIFVEYSLNTIGKLYNVEQVNNESNIYALDGEEYDDSNVLMFSETDLSLLDPTAEDDDF